MNKNIFSFLLILTSPYLMGQKSSNSPVIELIEPFYNFGKIKEENGVVKHKFYLINKGPGKLVIENVEASCDCTTSDYTKGEINEGDTAFVEAAFDPANRPGPFEKGVKINTNGNPKMAYLTFRGEVIKRPKNIFDVYSNLQGGLGFDVSLINYGNVYYGSIDTVEFSAYNFSNDSIKITSLQGLPAHIEVFSNKTMIAPGDTVKFMAIYNSLKGNEWGINNYSLELYTNDPQNPFRKLLLNTVNVVEDFSKLNKKQLANAPTVNISPTVADFGSILNIDTGRVYYTITNNGKSPLIIRDVKTACGCTGTILQKNVLAPGESTLIQAEFRALGRSGDVSKPIYVIVNDPKMPVIELEIKGKIVYNPNAIE